MEKFTKKDKSINYEIIRTNKKKEFYTTNIIDGVVYFSVPEYATVKDIKLILNQQFLNLYYKINPTEKNIVHFQGKQYNMNYVIANKDEVIIKGNVILVKSIKNTTRYLKSVLYKFFAKVVEEEIFKLMYDVQKDFKEITIPKIIVKHKDGYLGFNCLEKVNANEYKSKYIQISPIMAKYDPKYIKVLLYHEMCHSLVRGHGKDFWNLLNSKIKDGEKLNKEYKKINYDNDYL